MTYVRETSWQKWSDTDSVAPITQEAIKNIKKVYTVSGPLLFLCALGVFFTELSCTFVTMVIRLLPMEACQDTHYPDFSSGPHYYVGFWTTPFIFISLIIGLLMRCEPSLARVTYSLFSLIASILACLLIFSLHLLNLLNHIPLMQECEHLLLEDSSQDCKKRCYNNFADLRNHFA